MILKQDFLFQTPKIHIFMMKLIIHFVQTLTN